MVSLGSGLCVWLDEAGVLWGMGYNGYGGLGFGHEDIRNLPSKNETLGRCISVSCGNHFTVCVDDSGDVWAFGMNGMGQLGLGHDTNDVIQPQKVACLPPIVSVHCGDDHTLCVAEDSTLWAFGLTDKGQLGLGFYSGRCEGQMKPALVSVPKVIKIAMGSEHSFIQDETGTLWASGNNKYGQLGIGNQNNQNRFTALPSFTDAPIVDFDAGYNHSIFLASNGDVYAVGKNNRGQTGMGEGFEPCSSPVKVPTLKEIQLVSCGSEHTLVVNVKGDILGFGNNERGQLGMGKDCEVYFEPKPIDNFKDIRYICCGVSSSIAKDKQGRVWVFGDNSDGKLGLGDYDIRFTPTLLSEEYSDLFFTHTPATIKSARK